MRKHLRLTFQQKNQDNQMDKDVKQSSESLLIRETNFKIIMKDEFVPKKVRGRGLPHKSTSISVCASELI